MKNDIKLNYVLNIESIKYDAENNMATITDSEYTYYLVPYLRPKEDAQELYSLNEELLSKNVPSHSFVLNRNNQLLTTINNLDYIMLKLNSLENYEINLQEIINLNKTTTISKNKSKLYRNDWSNLWTTKIDYFEYQVGELGRGKQIIQKSFSYYVGLAENAIAYINEVERTFSKDKIPVIVLARKRIYCPNVVLNYFNPLSYIIDLNVRDMAEYIKASFFNGNDVWQEIETVFKREQFDAYSLHMFYARLLYPSYYFDVYESVMNKNLSDEELIPIINQVEDYEDFLADMYHFLSRYTRLIPVEWLLKKS